MRSRAGTARHARILYPTGKRDATRQRRKHCPPAVPVGNESVGLPEGGAVFPLVQIKFLRPALGVYEHLAQLRQGLRRIGHGIEQQGILFGNDLHMESILSENGTRCWM